VPQSGAGHFPFTVREMVLDEPTANLDFGNQVRVLGEIRTLAASGLALLFSTHHPEHAFLAADRVALLEHGRVGAPLAPDAAITPATMRSLYGVEVAVVPIPGHAPWRACVPETRP
jgi:iron complex transport system ATP-binding protein